MHSKLPRLILTLSVLCPSLSWAVGLGEIHLNSALNEPLNAEIALVAATPEELSSLHAALASRDTFTRYGIDRPGFLSSITFKVGKAKDGHDALLVRSNEAIPEPFVTFLVEVNWARGRLVREYTVLLDPPVYTPGESRPAAVAAPVTGAPAAESRPAPASTPAESATPSPAPQAGGDTYQVRGGDTLMKIARSLGSGSQVDQWMMALYRANPQAFDGNINVLRRGAVLRVPGAQDIAAQNQREAMAEVRRQMSAWVGSRAGGEGHLRLVPPGTSAASGTAEGSAATAEASALRGRVKDLEQKLTESRRLLDVRDAELAELQKKLAARGQAVPTPVAPPASAATEPAGPSAAQPAPAPEPAPSPSAEAPASAAPTPAPEPAPAASAAKPAPVPAAGPSGSWLDMLTDYWWALAGIVVVLLGGLGFAAWKRRQASDNEFSGLVDSGLEESRDPTSKLLGLRRGDESFVVEESGEHERPDIRSMAAAAEGATPKADRAREAKTSDDTLSSETAINLDQGDPLAEADFHMAYGLYDQAADLVRIALEREPDRRDLKLKLLEIYFVWGNKDLFLQSAKDLYASRDKAPAGEWDKILIMGKQICPDEPLFAKSAGSGMGAGALVDLNLEGGENRVDIDLFGEPEGEQSSLAPDAEHPATAATATGEAPAFAPSSDLDFVLDAPERGADQSPTREMPAREEPTVESEGMRFDSNSPTAEWETAEVKNKLGGRPIPGADATAELAIDDLGLDLDALEQTGTPSIGPLEQTGEPSLDQTGTRSLDTTDHPSDAPTMVAGLDEHSRKMMEEAEKSIQDRDLTELERELEASFIADLEHSTAGAHTAVIGPEGAPTVQMPRDPGLDVASTSRVKALEPDVAEPPPDTESTSRLSALSPDSSIDLDLDRLANAFSGTAETASQPRAAEDVFSSEVFESSSSAKGVDLDVGEPVSGGEQTTRIQAEKQSDTDRLKSFEGDLPELEPVTMSEVGTKLDLARAYMDMGDPEGARSILEEVASEGSTSQKQEARRLIESLPG
ncbi:MAG: FimV/HubP family polar landmark protein [Steroidobacteraceae bacterium]